MGTKTGIEWTDSTWSPIRVRVKANAAETAREKGYASLVPIAEKMAGHVGQHCEHVSPGCEHCYAETNNHRCLPANGTGLPYDRRSRDLVEAFVDEKALRLPLKWGSVVEHSEACELAWETLQPMGERRPRCSCPKRPRRIFVENQSDLFAEWATDEMRDRVFAVMALCPPHVFQVLTKRAARMLTYFSARDVRNRIAREASLLMRSDKRAANSDALAHVFLWRSLKTAEVGEYLNFLSGIADRCWPLSNVWMGVSVEDQAAADERIPLLLKTLAAVRFISGEPLLGLVTLPGCNGRAECKLSGVDGHSDKPLGGIDWVICGGESGPGARPMHPDWARSLRDQCAAAGVPFFFKQWGEWRPPLPGEQGATAVIRVGKKAAGALLDGVEHKAFPR